MSKTNRCDKFRHDQNFSILTWKNSFFFYVLFVAPNLSPPMPPSSAGTSTGASNHHPLLGVLSPSLFPSVPHGPSHNNNNSSNTNNNNISSLDKPKLHLPLSSPVQGEYLIFFWKMKTTNTRRFLDIDFSPGF